MIDQDLNDLKDCQELVQQGLQGLVRAVEDDQINKYIKYAHRKTQKGRFGVADEYINRENRKQS